MSQRVQSPQRTNRGQPAVRQRRSPGLRSRRRPRPAPVRVPKKFGLRWVSLTMIVVILGLMVFLFVSPLFYVTRAEIGGVQYVPAEEIFTASGIAGYHILWIDPEVVAERIAQSPSLSAAEVIVQWPARVVIIVREREPALVWQQNDQAFWVDVNGNMMVMRRELPGLVRVINEGTDIPFHCPGPACTDENSISIEPQIVMGAQQLKTLRDQIDVLYYDPARGLSYQDPRGWRAYFGGGTDMVFKLQVYERLVVNLEQRGIRPSGIDVSNPHAPYYRIAP